MKKSQYSLVALSVLAFVACNKDEDIVIENPVDINPLNYKIVEYMPAPGQYINDTATGFDNIQNEQQAILKAEERLAKNLFVSLGAWGGYMTVKFNESIPNSGDFDFGIMSNTFDTSNEPGIVWVMKDENGNGLPDDTWYELKGSYFGREGYERNYWVEYFRPAPGEATPWEDSNGETGEIQFLGSYHNQDFYYPQWINENSYKLFGSRLPSQAERDELTGNWTNHPFDWGYADNFGSDLIQGTATNRFRISDAVSEDNTLVNLSSIDFVKVQTAVNGSAGWLGENSTEVCGFVYPLK